MGRTRLLIGSVATLVMIAGAVAWMHAHDSAEMVASVPFVETASESELRALLRDPAVIAEGRRLYAGNCTLCHGVRGEGARGPNLRDDYWLGGSDMKQIVAHIADGRPSQGMAAWKACFDANQLHALAAFVATLAGSEDGSGKAPEGARRPITYR